MDGLRAPLARRLREALEAEGLRQEDLAEAMTGLGFAWTRNRVTQVVTGRGALSVLEIAGLCAVLRVSLADLLGGATQELALDAGSVPLRAILEALFYGESESWHLLGDRSAPAEQFLDELGLAHAAQVARTSTPPSEPAIYRTTAWGERAEATRKAARRLGVTPRDVEAAAVQLWGHALPIERDRRVDPRPDEGARALQARRAHVTRALLVELREHLAQAGTPTPDSDDETGEN
jgi:transcriptional regulator with XRE-family HTH domain